MFLKYIKLLVLNETMILSTVNIKSLTEWFSTGGNFPHPQEYLAMFEEILVVIKQVREVLQRAKHSAMYRTPLLKTRKSNSNVYSARSVSKY